MKLQSCDIITKWFFNRFNLVCGQLKKLINLKMYFFKIEKNTRKQKTQPKHWFQKNTTLKKSIVCYKSRFLSQDYKFNILAYLQYLTHTHTVALCSTHSLQNLLAENFRLKTKVFPLRRQVLTPRPPPAVWYSGKVQYMMSSGVTPNSIGTVPYLKNL